MDKNPRFETTEKRVLNCKGLLSIFDEIFSGKTRAEWFEVFKNCPDFMYHPVWVIPEFTTDPHMIENDYIVELSHHTLVCVKMLGIPVELEKTPVSIRTMAPKYGEHREEVLLDIGNYWQEITVPK